MDFPLPVPARYRPIVPEPGGWTILEYLARVARNAGCDQFVTQILALAGSQRRHMLIPPYRRTEQCKQRSDI
jgi:hypothetical protein